MAAIQIHKTTQDTNVHQELGTDVCRALELLTSKLTDMHKGKKYASPRDYAEIREARAIISKLKYRDSTEHVRLDELAWALKHIRDAYRADTRFEWTVLFDKAAKMLGLDLDDTHAIPTDLDRRISNELRLLSRAHAAAPLAVAV